MDSLNRLSGGSWFEPCVLTTCTVIFWSQILTKIENFRNFYWNRTFWKHRKSSKILSHFSYRSCYFVPICTSPTSDRWRLWYWQFTNYKTSCTSMSDWFLIQPHFSKRKCHTTSVFILLRHSWLLWMAISNSLKAKYDYMAFLEFQKISR